MPETRELVINTGPLIALTAAMGDLRLLSVLYQRVIVPLEVCDEIRSGMPPGTARRNSVRRPGLRSALRLRRSVPS